ncbi:MAG: lipoate--protein ligase family protein, partial [Opitutaceae bacterium]
AGVCFQRAEVHDVVHAVTGAKIAGAAQKRSRDGLLFQGSVWRPAAGEAVPWEEFADLFSGALAATLGAEATPVPWPDFPEGELEALTEQYSTPEWNKFR